VPAGHLLVGSADGASVWARHYHGWKRIADLATDGQPVSAVAWANPIGVGAPELLAVAAACRVWIWRLKLGADAVQVNSRT
jgi:hypothetical protein